MAGIKKELSQAMQDYAFKHVQIRSLPDEARALVEAEAKATNTNYNTAFNQLQNRGELAGIDVGGEILNESEVIANLREEFGTKIETARRHVQKAARRKRAPNTQWDERGGYREGAGRPLLYAIDVRDGRCYISKLQDRDGISLYIPCENWQELEDRAASCVASQGGSITVSGQYICPSWLRKTAVWREDAA